ncbi:MAG: sigma-54 interaction domain-containing protein [Eubacteriales bacterium]
MMAISGIYESDNQLNFRFAQYDHLPYAILIFDHLNRIIYYNERSNKLFLLSSCTTEHLNEIKAIFSTSINHLNEKTYHSKVHVFSKEYIYDYLPVFYGKHVKFQIIIIRDQDVFYDLDLEMAEIKKENYIFKKIIDSSYDGIFITNDEGRTLYFNDAFARISGFTRVDCIGMKVDEIINRGFADRSCSLEVIKQGKSVSTTVRYGNGNEAMLSGSPVFDENGNLIRVVINARDMTELNRVNEELKKAKALTICYRDRLEKIEPDNQRGIIYRSKEMEKVVDLASKVANSDVSVLILGDSGSGKDVIAKYIHNVSERAHKGQFVQINCGAIPETLLESELFGYEKGAFTGAIDKGKIGLFELANNGTFFLDEIGDMSLNLQVKLLNVIQEKMIMRLGGTKHIPINVRLIAATNKNMEKMVSEGMFRLDLYYRLNVVSINLPPLCNRKEDIIPLVEHYLKIFNRKYKTNKSLAPQSLNRFLQYRWPGNVRELINVLEKMVVTTEENQIKVDDLPANLRESGAIEMVDMKHFPINSIEELTYKDFMAEAEKIYIKKAMAQYKNLRKTADAMEIDVSTLVRKKQKYQI